MKDFILTKVRKDQFLSVYEDKRSTLIILLITIFIPMFIIISTASVVKVNTKRYVPSDEQNLASLDYSSSASDLNNRKTEILTLLLNSFGSTKNLEQEPDTYSIYVDILYQYLSNSDMNLSFTKYKKLKNEINDLYSTIQNEGTYQLEQMSIDGRTVALCLFKQIYKDCNLRIAFEENRTIQSISDSRGNILYGDMELKSNTGINISAIIIISLVLIALGSLCYFISNKKHLFNKEVVYDGFDEKIFA
jgi:ABC-type Na+ efflux pump permease subunit